MAVPSIDLVLDGSVLAVVPCSRRKIWDVDHTIPKHEPISARRAYVSTFHRLARTVGEIYADRTVILSAKFGFLDLDDPVPGNYDVTFGCRQDQRWELVRDHDLKAQIKRKGLDQYDVVLVLAGQQYLVEVEHQFRDLEPMVWPELVGCRGNGEMMSHLKALIGKSSLGQEFLPTIGRFSS